MGKYFGTDGIRGVAGRELTASLAMRVGAALGELCKKRAREAQYTVKGKNRMTATEGESEDTVSAIAAKENSIFASEYYQNTSNKQRIIVIIGKDTRISSDMLEAAVASGLSSAGVDVHLAGVIPTAALSYLTSSGEYSLGVMISASHNPYYDNGIKVISRDGGKLSEDEEKQLESLIEAGELEGAYNEHIGRISYLRGAREIYISHLTSLSRQRLDGLSLALDTSNGASSGIAGEVFRALGATVTEIAAEPNGINIGDGVGATHPEYLARVVTEMGLDAGFALDGDADRCIAINEKGEILDGDAAAYILARDMKRKDTLKGNTVVLTVMSGGGLIRALESEGIHTEITPVGDRYIAEAMKRGDYSLGSERSGHMILSEFSDTGDGIITALKLSEILAGGKRLSELTSGYAPMPQYTLNLRTLHKEIADSEEIRAYAEKARSNLPGISKLIIRKSGTEPIVRITVEAESEYICRELAEKIAERITRAEKRIANE